MDIETVEDLTNKIADWIGCYGTCKANGLGDGCEFSESKINCCRVGFNMEMGDRIRQAVENDKQIEKYLTTHFKI